MSLINVEIVVWKQTNLMEITPAKLSHAEKGYNL